ncbi:CCA tRNA nucleotidyltransferase [Peptacetobacter hominis]|uniref:CCA tRNA nucleotidyltransferase n=2 Tax=Peptacetobacter hominis TaxID=2743610 RepID=A0A544QY98_9FIRM|nr:CCA tRNA nucleotidyltransferase [Peptacetobacter hominis]
MDIPFLKYRKGVFLNTMEKVNILDISDIKIDIPKDVEYIIEEFEKNGFEAFAVGGCIRDSILGRIPNDWDITTDAPPDKIASIFEKTVDTGIEHGTVTVIIDRKCYEVTTYRIDGEYSDGRHPDSVEFSKNIEDDLKRRDFTINAMAYNYKRGLVDISGGIEDLNKGIIRCVGNPYKRFEEDALRMMRAIRFSAQLGFEIETDTKDAIKKLSSSIECISKERINTEFVKLIMSDASQIYTLGECNLLTYIIEEIEKLKGVKDFRGLDLYRKSVEMCRLCEGGAAEKMAALMWTYYICTNNKERKIEDIMKALRFDNKTVEKSSYIINYGARNIYIDRVDIKKHLNRFGNADKFNEYLYVREAEMKAELELIKDVQFSHVTEIIDAFDNEGLYVISEIRKIIDDIKEKGECFKVSELEITGKDIIKMGIKPGKQIGMILEEILKKVIKNPEMNRKDTLLKEAENFVKFQKYV